MPLYTYACADGHRCDLVRPIGYEVVRCPQCGTAALREQVYAPHVVGPTRDTRGMFRRYQEATAEIDHDASKIEANTGGSVATPPLWQMAKGRAAAIAQAGEEFRPLTS